MVPIFYASFYSCPLIGPPPQTDSWPDHVTCFAHCDIRKYKGSRGFKKCFHVSAFPLEPFPPPQEHCQVSCLERYETLFVESS